MRVPGLELPAASSEEARPALGFWLDLERTSAWLGQRGFTPAGARAKAKLLHGCASTLLAHGEAPATRAQVIYCPGRLEVFGKHTDYAGGRSLIAAPELGIAMLAVPREDDFVCIHSAQAPKAWSLRWSELHSLPTGWTRYPATVLLRLASLVPAPRRGAHLACASDLPLAAGMSSSSALLTATLLAFVGANRWQDHPQWQQHLPDRAAWALWASCVENGQAFGPFPGHSGVGTFGGSEDHTAMLCGLPGVLRQVSFGPLRFERDLCLPPEWVFLVAQSGVLAEKTAGAQDAYNHLAQVAADLLRSARKLVAPGEPEPEHLGAFLRSRPDAYDRLRAALDSELAPSTDGAPLESARRLWQFHQESEVWIPSLPAPDGPDAWAAWARTAAESTAAAHTGLGNQVPQTRWLTSAWLQAGARAASPFGAGFGGSVWALTTRDQAPKVLARLRAMQAPDEGLARGIAEARAIEIGPSAFWL